MQAEEYEIEMIKLLREMKIEAQKGNLMATKPLEAKFQKILTSYMLSK